MDECKNRSIPFTNLHDFGQDGLVEVVLQCCSRHISLQHISLIILWRDSAGIRLATCQTTLTINTTPPLTYQVEGSPVVIFLQELILSFRGQVGHHPCSGLELSLPLFLCHVVDVLNLLSFLLDSAATDRAAPVLPY